MAGAFSSTPIWMHPRCAALCSSKSTKHAQRLLSSLHAVSGDPTATDRLIRKFVASYSKSVALQTLSHFLSISIFPSVSSSFALTMYRRISEARWFRWNPKLVAGVVALLEKQGRYAEAETLISESVSRLGSRELAHFYCDLIESYSQHGLKQRVFDSYARLGEIPFAGRKAYESMIRALCQLDLPAAAEDLVKEMRDSGGFRPSPFEYRLVIQAYGSLGFFPDMRMVIKNMEKTGFTLDTVSANLILACYGDHGELSQMVSWLRKMRELGIPYSIRTYNSVLNSCPTVCLMLRDPKSTPLSINGLVEKLKREASPLSSNEALLVQELILSEVLQWVWTPSEGKLDLHGCHLGTAFVILLHWVEELMVRLGMEHEVPMEISVVCGTGKHSSNRGESPVKKLVSEMMFRMGSPLRVDRKNAGRFVARGKAMRVWLSSYHDAPNDE